MNYWSNLHEQILYNPTQKLWEPAVKLAHEEHQEIVRIQSRLCEKGVVARHRQTSGKLYFFFFFFKFVY